MDVHDAYDVVFAITTALEVIVELIPQTFVYIVPEERWMDIDLAIKVTEEEHRDASFRGFSR